MAEHATRTTGSARIRWHKELGMSRRIVTMGALLDVFQPAEQALTWPDAACWPGNACVGPAPHRAIEGYCSSLLPTTDHHTLTTFNPSHTRKPCSHEAVLRLCTGSSGGSSNVTVLVTPRHFVALPLVTGAISI